VSGFIARFFARVFASMGHLLSKAQSVGGRGRDRVQRDLKRRKIQGDAKRDFGQDPSKAPPAEAVSRICEVYQVIFFCLEIRKRTDKFLRLCDAKFAEAELREADLMVEVLKKETEMLVRKDADEEDSKRATAALRGFRA